MVVKNTLARFTGHHRKDMALDTQQPTDYAKIFAELTPEVFKRMEKNIHDVEAQAEAAMTEWESSPEDQALKAAYKKSRNLLETLRKEEWRKKLLYMDAAVIAARHDRARLKWDKEGSSYSLPIGRLNCYIKALRAQKDEILRAKPHSIIKLKGAVWHGNSSHNMDTLYVREAFPALIRARNLRIQALGWSESGCEAVFSGSSGVGTSCFGAFFMAQMLLKGRDVLLECEGEFGQPRPRHYYWLSLNAGVEHTLDKGLAIKRLIESASTPIYIVDGCHAGIKREMWGGETVVFCRLHEQLWHKEVDKTLLLCMGPASLEEILGMKKALPQHQALSDSWVEEWYSLAGGSIEICLQVPNFGPDEPEHWASGFKGGLVMASTEDVLEVIRPGSGGRHVHLECIFHWVYPESLPRAKAAGVDDMLYKYGHPCLRFASERLRSMAVMEMDPFVLAAIAKLDNKEGAERRYWMDTLNDSVEAHKKEARMYLFS
ncbi:g10239 [Coccomyxa viridis]|uniref:G10239 protein n=1 Tax=Coccomyxa viridis TaxID=1274662 RepID=A0ABP1G9R7_9CHLO